MEVRALVSPLKCCWFYLLSPLVIHVLNRHEAEHQPRETLIREQGITFCLETVYLQPLFTVFRSASLPGYPVAITMGNAIKNRASNEEILAILKELPNPNQDDDDGQFLLYSDASPLAALARSKREAVLTSKGSGHVSSW